jgi:hypothetical protein
VLVEAEGFADGDGVEFAEDLAELFRGTQAT